MHGDALCRPDKAMRYALVHYAETARCKNYHVSTVNISKKVCVAANRHPSDGVVFVGIGIIPLSDLWSSSATVSSGRADAVQRRIGRSYDGNR